MGELACRHEITRVVYINDVERPVLEQSDPVGRSHTCDSFRDEGDMREPNIERQTACGTGHYT